VIWQGYVERHSASGGARKGFGSAARLAREPEAILHSPEEVAAWIVRRAAELSTVADQDAAAKNALVIRHAGAYRGAAARGGSAYATVHLSRTGVADICAEHRPDDACPASPRGHNFQRNAKGEWRCTHCGSRL
jgi:ribosomal protein L37AE/L43A